MCPDARRQTRTFWNKTKQAVGVVVLVYIALVFVCQFLFVFYSFYLKGGNEVEGKCRGVFCLLFVAICMHVLRRTSYCLPVRDVRCFEPTLVYYKLTTSPCFASVFRLRSKVGNMFV